MNAMSYEQIACLLKEFTDLKLKQLKLRDYLGELACLASDSYVSPEEHTRLKKQYDCMVKYLDVLQERLNHL